MPQLTRAKSPALYAHPFSRAYWRDAAAELRDTRMLVFAALMIALRVALKSLAIPLAPGLKINIAFFINALGAMVFGPVVAIPAAFASDYLGVLLTGDVYFLPFALTEIAGSLIFALFLYRARVTPVRIALSRFCICLFVNILLTAPLMLWYYQVMLGKSYTLFTLPRILKNLVMFPAESVLLTLFLHALIPAACRLGLVYDDGRAVRFRKGQLLFLVGLFAVGVIAVAAYLNVLGK